jgi:hypothetical protein
MGPRSVGVCAALAGGEADPPTTVVHPFIRVNG